MKLATAVRTAIERRLAAIEHALEPVEGLVAEREGDSLRLHGRGLLRRSIDDLRLRFAGRAR